MLSNFTSTLPLLFRISAATPKLTANKIVSTVMPSANAQYLPLAGFPSNSLFTAKVQPVPVMNVEMRMSVEKKMVMM